MYEKKWTPVFTGVTWRKYPPEFIPVKTVTGVTWRKYPPEFIPVKTGTGMIKGNKGGGKECPLSKGAVCEADGGSFSKLHTARCEKEIAASLALLAMTSQERAAGCEKTILVLKKWIPAGVYPREDGDGYDKR